MQHRQMVGEYISAVMRRAFQPTVRVTDALQIMAASIAPAVADATGLPVPESPSLLGYIGAATVAYIFLRLLIVAPFQVWREQVQELGIVKLELSKPERIELARLSEIRAGAKAELAELISLMLFLAIRGGSEQDERKLKKLVDKGIGLCGRANASRSFDTGFVRLANMCSDILVMPIKPAVLPTHFLNDLLAYLHGEITAEDLALRLPPKPAS